MSRSARSAFDLVIAGGTVVTSAGRYEADLGISDGLIRAVGADLSGGAEVIDATGCLLLPGVIDAHVHPIHAENMATTSEAAAFGGVTTLLHHIYDDPEQGLVDNLRAAQEEGEATSLLDFGVHARLTNVRRQLDELAGAVAMGVSSFKMFTAYRSRGIMTDDGDLLLAMERIGQLGGLAMCHAENGGIIDVLEERARGEGRTRPLDYPATRPPEAEAEAVNRATIIASLARCPLYVVHISCALALTAVMSARARGQLVYAETCPHYLLLTADEAMPQFGAKAKIAPPLRTGDDVEELWRAVADGRVDVVGSDHSAFAPAEKESPTGNVWEVGFGAPGIETMLSLMIEEGAGGRGVALERLVAVLAEAPARIFGLAKKGALVPGMDADIVVFDPWGTRTLGDRQHGRAYYSLYAGRTVHGAVRIVLQRGTKVVDRDRLVAHPGTGRFVRSTRAAPTAMATPVAGKEKVPAVAMSSEPRGRTVRQSM